MQPSSARRPLFSTIGSKVLAGLLVAALLPLVASILVSLTQIDRMTTQSINTGSDALSASAQNALMTQANDIALTTGQRMQLINNTTAELASYASYLLSNPTQFSGGAYNQAQTIKQDPNGNFWYNPTNEPDSVYMPETIQKLTPSVKQMLNIQTYLDAVFKAHFDQDQYPTYFGAMVDGNPALTVIRYYAPDPKTPQLNADLAHLVGAGFDVTKRPWFVAANPQNDPKKLTVFSHLYDDATGKGLTITSSTPVYDANGNFIGVIGRDVFLVDILKNILPTKIGQKGYPFLVNQDGSIISMPAAGQIDFGIALKVKTPADLLKVNLNDQGDPSVTNFTKNLPNQQPGITRLTLNGQEKYLAFVPVQGTPWDVVVVRPVSEVLAPISALNGQLTQQTTQTRLISLGLTVSLIVLAALVAYLLSRNIARPLLAITRSAQYLATGQSIYQDPEIGKQQDQLARRGDEVGQLARAFEAIERYFLETSQLADQIAQGNLGVAVHRTSDQDRLGLALENMMSYLNQILQVATRLAVGDLSHDIQPRSSSDILGNALKYMVDELSTLVVRVQSAGREIEAASVFVLQRSALLVEASEHQMDQIMHATGEAGQMAESNHRVAEDTYTLAHVAYNSRTQAQSGYQAVQQAVGGMSQIQEDVRLSTQRVSQLNRRMQEITRVVEVISNIAHQTNRLALDAAIHAQTAGPHGRNFSMVAQSIRHLAEQVKDEVNQISRLVQSIIEETNQAIQASKQSQQQVIEGMNLASTAGSALESIAQVVDQQGQMVEVINRIAKQQRETSMAVAQEMQAAYDITVQYNTGTRQTAQSIERLAYLARQLKESVEVFILPNSYNGMGMPRRTGEITGQQMRPPIRSVRPTPLLPQGSSLGNQGTTGGMNGRDGRAPTSW